MAELPELTILQRQMHEALTGRTITLVEARQEKCLNVSTDTLVGVLTGRGIDSVTRRGKWLFLNLTPAYHLLLNLGMGADLWHYARAAKPPEKYHLRLGLSDGSGFTCRFWWFGYVRLLAPVELPLHRETAKLGPSPLEIDAAAFAAIARRFPRANVKALILDQTKLSGIGNAYAHDVLWKARLHPTRKLGALSDNELHLYHQAIQWVMTRATALGGFEPDFFRQGGNAGHWEDFMLIGYKEGKPCPDCRAPIAGLKTGATKTYICPECQKV